MFQNKGERGWRLRVRGSGQVLSHTAESSPALSCRKHPAENTQSHCLSGLPRNGISTWACGTYTSIRSDAGEIGGTANNFFGTVPMNEVGQSQLRTTITTNERNVKPAAPYGAIGPVAKAAPVTSWPVSTVGRSFTTSRRHLSCFEHSDDLAQGRGAKC
jgi:hypothetical protein